MADLDQFYTALRNADAAGDTVGAKRLADYIRSAQASTGPVSGADAIPLSPGAAERMKLEAMRTPAKAEPSFLDKVTGGIEAARNVATGLTSGAVGYVGGALGGIAGSIASGDFGTEEGLRRAKEEAEAGAARLTYQPKTDIGREYAQNVSEAINATGIQGIPIPELDTLGRSVGSSYGAVRNLAEVNAGAANAADVAAAANPGRLRDLVREPSAPLAGVGAASVDEALQRVQRAQDLPVPIDLTRGQAERDFAQQRFERETAKNPELGAPLRSRFEEQNAQMIQNIDAFKDLTGAEQASLRGVGESVINVLAEKQAAKKAEINQAYAAARDAGDMAQPVDIAPLRQYLADNEPAAINAPILDSVQKYLDRLDDGSGQIPINDLEELRKSVGRLAQPGTPNAVFGGDVMRVIDGVTAEQGGPLYQQARRMYQNYASEFKNRQVIKKLLSVKPGTSDRSVALEDVFDHAIMRGSLDDVRAVRRTLQTAGDNGEQAWRELQGQTIESIKDSVTSNVARDSRGNPIVSPAKLDRIVNRLDDDGKLDFIFGKKGAEQIRAVNDLAKDVYTAPPNAVNTSNTASVLIDLLDKASSGVSMISPHLGAAINYGAKRLKNNAVSRKVAESLNAPYSEALRKQSQQELIDTALNSVEPQVQQIDSASSSANPALQAEIDRIRGNR